MKDNSLLNEFIRYVSLNVLGMVGLSCYILADTFFVSKGLGSDGLAALNLAIPIFSFVNGSGLMLGMGGATKFTVFKAQGKNNKCNTVFMNTIYLAVVFSAVFIITGLLFSQNITGVLGADTNIFNMTNKYLKVILLFSPAFIMNNIVNCYVRNDGNPKLAMLGMLFGSFSNIIFDYIFIFPLNMGIFGAVLATGFSPVVGLCILSTHFIKKQNSFTFKPTVPNAVLMGENLSLGVPSLITEVSSGVVIIIFNALILKYKGNVGVAAYGVIANISIVVIAVFTGIAQGLQPVASRAFGEQNFIKTRKSLKYAVVTVITLSIILYAVIFTLSNKITAVFNSEGNPELQKIAEFGLKLYFIGTPFAGLNIIFAVYFSSTEKPVPAQIISVCRGFAVIIPTAFLMAYLLEVVGIWLTFPIAECFVLIIALLCFRKNKSETVLQK